MTATIDPMPADPASEAPDPPRSRRPPAVLVVAALALLVLAGAIGYELGGAGRPQAQVHVGRAYVGINEASVKVGDLYAGFVTHDAVQWLDEHHVWHDGGIAPCLTKVGTNQWITFGSSRADLPDGGWFEVVTWVRCGKHA